MEDNEPVLNEVIELTGEESGRWVVTTEHSKHRFDLDAGTVQRMPGTDAVAFNNDGSRPLRTIVRCRVGEQGYWTMYSSDFLIEFEWHLSTDVMRIERLPDVESAGVE